LPRDLVRLIAGRIGLGFLTLLTVSLIVFGGTELVGGDASTAILGQQSANQQLRAEVRHELGLDRPVYVRYAEWLGGVAHGDLGTSLTVGSVSGTGTGGELTTNAGAVEVKDLVAPRVGNSLLLMGAAAVITIPLAIFLGVMSALRPGRSVDNIVSTTTLGLVGLPEFVIGAVLVLVFAIGWGVLPAVSLVQPGATFADRAEGLVLPVMTLCAVSIAYIARMMRGSMIEVLESDYIQFARLKGMPERRVIYGHAVRNAMIPTVQAVALTVAWLVGGIVVVEVLFSYPGMGQGLAAAVSSRDTPTVQAFALLIAAAYVVLNLVADLVTMMLSPKLRHPR
jgi:peptide/nickel transport system permease protein